ncbi:MAG TPA: amidase [Gemmatimonadales bacterium]|jgi:Asp-tRNA(Asn)/Glu-tRNA(Gln) amidotransferase A subunit family amidase
MTAQHQLTDRRRFLAYCSAIGLGGAVPELLWARAQDEGTITKDMLAHAEAIAGVEFTDAERELMLDGVNRNLRAYRQLHETAIPNEVPPALVFNPVVAGRTVPAGARRARRTRPTTVLRPDRLEDVAFWPIADLAELIRGRQVSSVELTTMYLERLRRHGPKLECVITLTEDLALRQARRADAELARGTYRGPLHGIPWGAKDLLAEDAYKTTWGAKPFQDQHIDYDATVVRRLEDAGAVLVAKLTLGALAWGDVWFGGQTRNPWNTEQGSSGSSAGSASATVAGLVGFSIGSETLGSIVSPATRCGATGLRPTFGRVSRWGAMALSWSMDKLGPICRSVEDCALVLSAIYGPDGKDPTVQNVPFAWDSSVAITSLRIGYLKSAFEREPRNDRESGLAAFDRAALGVLQGLGVDLIPLELSDEFPVGALNIILNAEAAAAFDELTRSGRDDELVRQIANAWPNVFRQSRLIPAVEYIQANRVRTMIMHEMDAIMDGIDLFVTPSFAGTVLLTTNLTGHPAISLPNGYTENGSPVSLSFIGQLFREDVLLAAAKSYQDATGFHRRHPPAFA